MTACNDTAETKRKQRPSRYGYQSESSTVSETQEVTPLTPPPTQTVETTTSETVGPAHTEVKTTAPPPVKKDYPYGTPVPGKAGFVTSPHAPYSGYVDVRGFPPGTEVKDPYTGKVFLVP